MRCRAKIVCLTFSVFLLVSRFGVAHAQSDNADGNTANSKVASLERETKELKAETEKLKAETEKLKERFPVIEGGKEGAITRKDGGIYAIGALAQVYNRLEEVAMNICTVMKERQKKAKETSLTLVSEQQMNSAFRYNLVKTEIIAFDNLFNALQVPAPAPAPAPAPPPGVVGTASVAAASVLLPSFISIAKLFRTDKDLFNEDVSVSEADFHDMVFSCLNYSNENLAADTTDALKLPEIKYPAIEALYSIASEGKSDFFNKLRTLLSRRTDLQAIISNKAKPEEASAAKAVAERFDTYVNNLLSVPAGQTVAPIYDVLRGEAVATNIKDGVPVLAVGIAKQGGVSMVTKSFWRGDRLYVGGGAVATYRLIKNGKLILGKTISNVDPSFVQVDLKPVSRNYDNSHLPTEIRP